MVNLTAIAEMIQERLNSNEKKIKFEIKADRDEYVALMPNVEGFVVPGILTALTGNYEPLQGIKVYSVPLALELFCYAALDYDFPSIPFTFEQQKECLSSVIEALNGTTEIIENSAVMFEGATVAIGNATAVNGGGLTRIPIMATIQLVGVEKVKLFNDSQIKIDTEEIFFSEFSAGITKVAKSITRANTTMGKTIAEQMSRTFVGTALFSDSIVLTGILDEVLAGEEINKKHTLSLNFDGRGEKSFDVIITGATIGGQMGGAIQITLTMSEAYK